MVYNGAELRTRIVSGSRSGLSSPGATSWAPGLEEFFAIDLHGFVTAISIQCRLIATGTRSRDASHISSSLYIATRRSMDSRCEASSDASAFSIEDTRRSPNPVGNIITFDKADLRSSYWTACACLPGRSSEPAQCTCLMYKHKDCRNTYARRKSIIRSHNSPPFSRRCTASMRRSCSALR